MSEKMRFIHRCVCHCAACCAKPEMAFSCIGCQSKCVLQVSLPMLAPLLLGTGMLLRSIRANASFVFPRIGLLVVLMWVLWFANSVVQSTCVYLRRQGAIAVRLSGAIITTSECAALLAAGIIVLSMLGVNVSALLLPAGVALAFAAKDLSHNFLAGAARLVPSAADTAMSMLEYIP